MEVNLFKHTKINSTDKVK